MAWPSYVLPFESDLIAKLHNQRLVVIADCANCMVPIAQAVQQSGNILDCIILRYPEALEKVAWSERWGDIPIIIEVPTFGKFHNFSQKFDLLRKLDVRIQLPLNSEQNSSALRILSSLGIATCALFTPKTDWEAALDLMTYALLGRAPHAPIQPFNYIAANYRNDTYRGWQSVMFNDPQHYLHVNSTGQVAATAAALATGDFLHSDVTTLTNLDQLTNYQESLFTWQQHFLANDECARCPGWKSCRGGVADIVTDKTQCAALFTEIFELAAQYQQQLKQPQPRQKRWLQV